MTKSFWVGAAWLVAVACTRPNPAVCCLDQADCDEVGIEEVRDCAASLACVDHECVVPSCSTTGCEATAPVCNITTDVCEGCTSADDCSRFTDTGVCDTASGACVECIAASDCPADRPLCDANACRACKLDSECASGACGDDGACVAESAIVYLDPSGTNAGACERSAPCRNVSFALTQTSPTRNHLVMAPGGYIENNALINSQTTTASHIFIHGGGASMSTTAPEAFNMSLTTATTIRHLHFFGDSGGTAGGINLRGAAHVLEDVQFSRTSTAVYVYSSATIRDLTVDTSSGGIYLDTAAHLTLDRATIKRGFTAIHAPSTLTTVEISNLLVYGTSNLALNLPTATGTLTSVTIADSGSDSGTGPRAVACSSMMTVRSSIIWAPGTASRVAIEGCNLISTIAGPTPVPGAMNVDPLFIDRASGDYHLAPNSPARDALDTGPMIDFEGDARPQGVRYDIGADEATP